MAFDVLTKAMAGFAGREARAVSAGEPGRIRALHDAFLARTTGGRRAILTFANLARFQDLSGWCLAEADLSGALPRQANLARADLRDTNLFGADLTGADLTGADLTEACLESADLRGATLCDAILTRCEMSRVDLREGMLMGSEAGQLRQTHGDGGTAMQCAKVAGAMQGAKVAGAKMHRARLSNIFLTLARQVSTRLTGAAPMHATLVRADLTDADLTDADLTGADLCGADLTDAALSDAVPPGADLTQARLDGAI